MRLMRALQGPWRFLFAFCFSFFLKETRKDPEQG
jgi:hypothetical protein